VEERAVAGVPNGIFPFKLVVTELDGSKPDFGRIGEEEWAQGLDDPVFFALDEDGGLLLMDRFSGYSYPPPGRFLLHVEIGPGDLPSGEEDSPPWK